MNPLLLTLLVAGPPLSGPDFESLEARIGAPTPPAGCHVYTGEITERVRFPIVGMEGGDFHFEGRLIDGMWTYDSWQVVSVRRGLGAVEVDMYEDNHSLLRPMYGQLRTPDEREHDAQVAQNRRLEAQAAEALAEQRAASPIRATTGKAKPDLGGAPAAQGPIPPAALDATQAETQAGAPAAAAAAQAPQAQSESPQKAGWMQRAATRLAVRQAMGEYRETIVAAGLDVDAVEDLLVAIALGEAPADPLEALGGLSPEQLGGLAQAALTAGDASSEEAALAMQALQRMAIEAAQYDPASVRGLVSAAKAGDDEGLLNALESMDKLADEVAAPPVWSAEEAARDIGFSYATPAPQVYAAAPPPEGDELRDDVAKILEYVDTNVEMRQVVPGELRGRQVWIAERLLDSDTTVAGRQRRSGEFMTFDKTSLAPLAWRVQTDHPVAMKKADAAGKLRSFAVEVQVDSAGHAISEDMQLWYTLGPIVVRMDRGIVYHYEGRCQE